MAKLTLELPKTVTQLLILFTLLLWNCKIQLLRIYEIIEMYLC
jgi:hypothetical protein